MPNDPGNKHEQDPHLFLYTVDGEPQKTSQHELTARQILVEAGFDPATRYLIQLIGNVQDSFESKPDVPIHMHEHMVFITASIGPMPVS